MRLLCSPPVMLRPRPRWPCAQLAPLGPSWKGGLFWVTVPVAQRGSAFLISGLSPLQRGRGKHCPPHASSPLPPSHPHTAPHGSFQQLLQLPHGPPGGHTEVPDGQQQPREDCDSCVQPFRQGHLLPAQNPHQPPAQWAHQLQGELSPIVAQREGRAVPAQSRAGLPAAQGRQDPPVQESGKAMALRRGPVGLAAPRWSHYVTSSCEVGPTLLGGCPGYRAWSHRNLHLPRTLVPTLVPLGELGRL